MQCGEVNKNRLPHYAKPVLEKAPQMREIAGAPGFEPRSTAPKAGVLPLHHAPMRTLFYHKKWVYFFFNEPVGRKGPVNLMGASPGFNPNFCASANVITSGVIGRFPVFSTASSQKASRSLTLFFLLAAANNASTSTSGSNSASGSEVNGRTGLSASSSTTSDSATIFSRHHPKRLQNILHITAHEHHAFHCLQDAVRIGKSLCLPATEHVNYPQGSGSGQARRRGKHDNYPDVPDGECGKP